MRLKIRVVCGDRACDTKADVSKPSLIATA